MGLMIGEIKEENGTCGAERQKELIIELKWISYLKMEGKWTSEWKFRGIWAMSYIVVLSL